MLGFFCIGFGFKEASMPVRELRMNSSRRSNLVYSFLPTASVLSLVSVILF